MDFVYTLLSFLQLDSDDIIASGAGDDAIGLFVDSKQHDPVRNFLSFVLLSNLWCFSPVLQSDIFLIYFLTLNCFACVTRLMDLHLIFYSRRKKHMKWI